MKKYTAKELFADSIDGKIKVIAMIETGRFHLDYISLGLLRRPKPMPNPRYGATFIEKQNQRDRYQSYLDERECMSEYFSQFTGLSFEEVSQRYNQTVTGYIERWTLFSKNEEERNLISRSQIEALNKSLGEVEPVRLKVLDQEHYVKAPSIPNGVDGLKPGQRTNLQQDCIVRHLEDFHKKKNRPPTKKELWRYMMDSNDGVVKIGNKVLEIEGKEVDYDAFRQRKFVKNLA